MRAIQIILTSALVLLAIISLIAGVFGGATHLLVMAIISLIVAYVIFNSDKEDREIEKQINDLHKRKK